MIRLPEIIFCTRMQIKFSTEGGQNMKGTSHLKAIEFSSRRGHPEFSIFEPDTIALWQHLKTCMKSELDPEIALMLAVLEEAVHNFQKYIFARHAKERALYNDAEEWFFEGVDSEVFSFKNVCETLGYDANYLRKGLIEWKSCQSQPKIKRRV